MNPRPNSKTIDILLGLMAEDPVGVMGWHREIKLQEGEVVLFDLISGLPLGLPYRDRSKAKLISQRAAEHWQAHKTTIERKIEIAVKNNNARGYMREVLRHLDDLIHV